MKYLSNAVNFSIKNWMLILPVFVLTAIVSLVSGVGTANLNAITSMFNANMMSDPGAIMAALPAIYGAVAGAGVVAFIAKFIYEPATYGLINKGLETGNSGLNDIGAAISSNFVKYVMYFIGMLVVSLVSGLAAVLLVILLSLLVAVLKGVGVFLMVIVMIAVVLFLIALGVLLSMWFTAMVVDGLDVVAAAKKSIEVVKSCFWTVLGITLLVWLLFAVAGLILKLLLFIPLVGPIIYSVVPAGQYFVMAVFLLMVYRDKTGRTSAA
ncbi:MAG TPA: hypothetical protein VHT96_11455 [Clostridia bacterium]|nr:hypothetical protein [Clostridia bacterium]